jgi:hypothetical protein
MNKQNKALFKTISLLGLVLIADVSLAHTFSGGLGSARTATDYYRLTCNKAIPDASSDPDGAKEMVISIRDTSSGGSLVGVILSKPDANGVNQMAYTSIDAVGGLDNTAYSPIISLPGGEGAYYATVFHTGNSSDNYGATFHCQDKFGVHSGTAAFQRLSNQ